MGLGLNSGGGPSRGYMGGVSPQGPLMSQMNTGVSGGSVSSYSVQTTGASSFTDMNAAAAETSLLLAAAHGCLAVFLRCVCC